MKECGCVLVGIVMKEMRMLMEEEMVVGKINWVLVGRRDGRRRVLGRRTWRQR